MLDAHIPDYSNTPASPDRPRFEYVRRSPVDAPLVSIVTPFHNPGIVFEQTITAILRQSLPHWEWVIVDDGSSDPVSLELLSELARGDDRVRVIRNETSQGPGAARNQGVAQARCEYVMLLDADDLIEPTTLEKAAWVLATDPGVSFVKGFSVGFGASEYVWCQGFHSGASILESNTLTITSMVRRSVWETVGGFDVALRHGCEDWEFWVKCAHRGYWGRTIPEILDWYRRRDDHHVRWKEWDQGERLKKFGDELRRRHPLSADEFPNPRRQSPAVLGPARRTPPIRNPLSRPGRRLLMVLPWCEMGGADKFNLRLIQQLRSRGWEVTIVTTLPAKNKWLPEFTAETPDVFVLDHFVGPGDEPAFLRYLIESRSPDVVLLTNSEFGYGLAPYLRSVCPDPAYVDYCHMEEEGWKSGGHPRHSVGMQEQLDLCVVASEHLKRWMVARGADPTRIEVCYINESTADFRPDPTARSRRRAELGVSDQTAVILFAGRICPQKQPRVFARVMEELARRQLDFIAVVAGDGEDRPWLERFVQEHGLEARVHLMGALPNAETREWMAASDVFFLPSEWEGIALSIYEAMAMELAVVGADVGGQKELVTPDVGLLLTRGSEEEEVARYSEALAELVQDPARRARMGKAARRRIAQSFELSQMGSRMIELFERALSFKQEAPRVRLPEKLANELVDRFLEQMRTERELARLWRPAEPTEEVSFQFPHQELFRIESSRPYRLLNQVKQLAPYRMYARYRWGDDWSRVDPLEPAEAKLSRIKNSPSYRAYDKLRRIPVLRWYAQQRSGPS